MEKTRVVFMGTPEFACKILQALLDVGTYEVVGVVSQPDKPVGRKREIKFSPVKELALQYQLMVVQPINIKREYQQVLDLEPEVIVTCAYGQIVPRTILDTVKYGCINVHASLLPKLRGGAPIHKAIINGNEKTGVTIMKMAPKMDAGAMYSKVEVVIDDNDNVGSLHDKLSIAGAKLLIDSLPDIISGNNKGISQNEMEATFAYNITREEEKIAWDKTSREIYNQIRGLNPWPVAYTTLNNKQIKIYQALIHDCNNASKHHGHELNGTIIKLFPDSIGVKVADGVILITEIQLAGKKRMLVKDYLLGNSNIVIGDRFI